MTGFEHDEYELTGSSRHNLTLEFSINNGEWFECEPVQVFYDESGKGVYQILSATYNYGDSEVSSFTIIMTGQNVEPGEFLYLLVFQNQTHTTQVQAHLLPPTH